MKPFREASSNFRQDSKIEPQIRSSGRGRCFRKTRKKNQILVRDSVQRADNCKDLCDPLHMEQAGKHEYILAYNWFASLDNN